MQYPPFERLPRVFVPRRPMTLRPPRFHYGWPINVPKLLALAEAHGLTVTRSSDRVASGPENDDTGTAHPIDGGFLALSCCHVSRLRGILVRARGVLRNETTGSGRG